MNLPKKYWKSGNDKRKNSEGEIPENVVRKDAEKQDESSRSQPEVQKY